MKNEAIGILAVLALTFLLFVLRHLILPSQRSTKRHSVAPIAPCKKHDATNPIGDDAWLLLKPNVEDERQIDRGQSNEPYRPRRKGAVKTMLLEVKSNDLERNKESGR